MIYEYQEYPKTVYGRDGAKKFIPDTEAEAALDGEWFDSPAKVPVIEPDPEPEPEPEEVKIERKPFGKRKKVEDPELPVEEPKIQE